MSSAPVKPPLLASGAGEDTPQKTLRRLFLTLFLRGRGARGLNRNAAPKSVGKKLALTLAVYALIGCFALTLLKQPVFALAVYLHAMTFAFLGMFVASSAGEILFNREEADILLHRPIDPRALLWAKVRVLVEVSLWIAGAFNFAGFFAGLFSPEGGWRFPIVHALSTALEALFCTGCVVLVYQLCLRLFGRDRLEGLMTLTQVLVSVGAVLSGQILPRLIFRMGDVLTATESSWWIFFLPPAWFAGFDDAFAGSAGPASWLLAAVAVVATTVVLRVAFGRLAHNYETGLQAFQETTARRKQKGRRGIRVLLDAPPLCWWLRNPVERASFLLVAAYLVRDRDVKLRVFPGIAPMLIMPFIFLLQGRDGAGNGFGIAFTASYLGLVPMLGLNLLQYSQQWQASDVFRFAPLAGPAPLCHGARRAVLCFLTLPVLLFFALVVWLMRLRTGQWCLLLPGIVTLPVYALVPALVGRTVPLSVPVEEAKSAGRGLTMIMVMLIAMGLSLLASFAWNGGWFWQLLAGQTVASALIYLQFRSVVSRSRWTPAE